MPKPKHTVHDLNVVETALVDDGDNPNAKIVLFKSGNRAGHERADDGKDASPGMWAPMSTAERLAKNEFMEDFYEVRCAYVDSMNEILWCVPASDMGALLEKSTKEFEDAVTSLLDGIAKRAPSLAKAGRDLIAATVEAAHSKDPETITKALEAFGAAPQDKESSMPAPNTTSAVKANPSTTSAKSVEEILASLPDEQRAAVKASLDAAQKAKDDAEAAAKKATDDAVKAKEADVDAKLKAAEERQKAVETELAKMKDEKVTEDMKSKAREIGVGDVEVTAGLLKSAYGRSPDEGKKLEEHLKAMAAQVKKNDLLTKAIGSSHSETAPPGDALEAKANEIMASEKISFHAAYEKAVEKHPELASASFGAEQAKRRAAGG